jgi:hypothetical protein
VEFWISGLIANGLSAGESPFVVQHLGGLNDVLIEQFERCGNPRLGPANS